MNRSVEKVRRLPGELFTCTEVANAVQISPATLRRLSRADPDVFGPNRVEIVGGLQVWLFDLGTVERVHRHRAERIADGPSVRGRPRLWDDAERARRRAAHSAASYQRRRARSLRAQAAPAAAAEAQQRAERLTAALRAEHAERASTLRQRVLVNPLEGASK